MSTTPDAVRAEFASWLDDRWDRSLSLIEWRRRLVGGGWAVPSWPESLYGRGLPTWADIVVREELHRAGAPGTPIGPGMQLAAPTLARHATAELQERFLPPTLTGEMLWCQLFSEPGAGSDLAGLSTTAELDGDEWIVNGQKVWNTSAHHAHYGLLLVRTDWDQPKHAGLSYLLLPMGQPGVEVRPLRQMNGHASFNEVFLTEARVPRGHVVGTLGEGWSVAKTTLAHERTFATMRRRSSRVPASSARAVLEAAAEAEEHFGTYAWYPQRAGRSDLLIERAQTLGLAGDPVIRQEIAKVYSLVRAGEWTMMRAAAARRAGRPPGPEGSVGKLAASRVAHRSAAAHGLIAGARGLLKRSEDPLDAVVAEVLVSTPAQSIAGGTDEIQRNIIAERILGLPRQPDPYADRSFREVPH